MLVDLHTICKEIFAVVELHEIQKKSTAKDNKTDLHKHMTSAKNKEYPLFDVTSPSLCFPRLCAK